MERTSAPMPNVHQCHAAEAHRPLRLLILEDSADDAALLVAELRAAGLEFAWERHTDVGGLHEALRRADWDLVITDYNLPQLSAREVIRAICSDPRDIPVVLVSGYIGEEEAVSLIKLGAADFVPKSNLIRLAAVVRRAIREAESRRRERAALQALQEQERFLREVLGALGEGVMVLNGEYRIIFVNREAERLVGWTEAELLGRSAHATLHYLKPDGSPHPAHECPVRGLTRDGDRCRVEDDVYVRKDGSLLPVSYVATRVAVHGQVLYVEAFQDRSERKRAEEALESSRRQLQELSAFLQQVREEERAHIARELHDELGQLLSGVHMGLEWLQRHLPRDNGPQDAKVDAMLEHTRSALATVRRISSHLRPAVLDDLGLEAAVEWLVDGFRVCSGLKVELELSLGQVPLSDSVATALFRIVQESLTNIGRHAEARSVAIRLVADDRSVRLRVRDDGKGFDATAPRQRTFGLLGMRERTLALGGRFDVRSESGAGTCVSITIPLHGHGAPEDNMSPHAATSPAAAIYAADDLQGASAEPPTMMQNCR